MTAKPRGVCPTCGKDVSLLGDGRPYPHQSAGTVCLPMPARKPGPAPVADRQTEADAIAESYWGEFL